MLVLWEQFTTSCHKELSAFFRERKLKTLKKVVDAAETFLEAHGGQMSSVIHATQVKKSPEDSSHCTMHSDNYQRSEKPSPGECHMKKGSALIVSRLDT